MRIAFQCLFLMFSKEKIYEGVSFFVSISVRDHDFWVEKIVSGYSLFSERSILRFFTTVTEPFWLSLRIWASGNNR